MKLTIIDWIISGVMVGGLVWSGYWGKRLVKSVAQFTVAGRSMGMWLGMSTGAAETMGLICIATGVQMGFTSGFSYLWVTMASVILNIVCFGLLGLGIMRYRATNVQTLPQYFEMRYNRPIRVFAGITMGVGGVLNMALFPIVESQFLIGFIGLPPSLHILGVAVATFPIVLLGILAMSLFFTAIGGMVSIIITEYIQAVIMFISLTAITVLIMVKAGPMNLTHALETHIGNAGFNPLVTQSLGIAFVMSWLIGSFMQRLAFPPTLQKSSSAKTPRIVKQQFLLSNVFGLGRLVMFNLWGIAALVLVGTAIPHGQNPEEYQRMLGGIMLRQITPPVLMGVALASFLFASVSTVNVYLLSWSSVLANDVISTIRKKPLSPEKHLYMLRCVTLGVAAFIFVFGLLYKPSEMIAQWFVITGAIFGGSGVLAWFGLYWRRASNAGAWAALVSSVVIPIGWIVVKQIWPEIRHGAGSAHSLLSENNIGLLANTFPILALIVPSLFSRKQTTFVDYGKRLRAEEARENAASEAAIPTGA